MLLYYIEDIMSVFVVMIEEKCDVRTMDDLPNLDFLVVQHLYDLDTRVHIIRLDICLNLAFYLPRYL
jgi:hypothetical protein